MSSVEGRFSTDRLAVKFRISKCFSGETLRSSGQFRRDSPSMSTFTMSVSPCKPALRGTLS